jgi:hypothetical protein
MLILGGGFAAVAQNDESSDNPTKAKTLKSQYEKEDLVISNQDVQVSFARNADTGKIEVTEETKTVYLSITNYVQMTYSTGYDNESEIEELSLYLDEGKRSASWDLQDEAYSSQSIFHNDYRVKYGKIIFKKQGATVRVEEKVLHKDVKYFTTHYFNDNYRVLEGSVTFNIPDWLDVELKEYHLEGYDIARSEAKKGDEIRVTFDLKEIKPRKSEYREQGSSFIYPHILILSKSFINDDGATIRLFSETKDLYSWYSKLTREVTIETTEIDEKVTELTDGLATDDEKVRAIYYWVQDNIKYIAFEEGIAGFKPDAPQNVYKKRYGDCKGMAILLKTMLISAGYDARLVWIGTDAIAYDYSTPSLSVDNHMIAAIMVDGDPIFIDGTEKYNSYGTFASRIQGKQALIENGDTFKLATVPESTADLNLESYNAILKIEDDHLIGKVKRVYQGEQVSSFLYNFTGLPQSKRVEVLEQVLTDGNDNAKIENTTAFDHTDRDGDVEIEYDFRVNNAVSNFDNTYYLELDPVRYLGEFQMDGERENSFFFSNTRKEIKNFVLKIPEGYTVSSTPADLNIDNDHLLIDMKYLIKDSEIVYTSNITIKQRLLPKESFDVWNESIKQLKSFYDEQIVLTK